MRVSISRRSSTSAGIARRWTAATQLGAPGGRSARTSLVGRATIRRRGVPPPPRTSTRSDEGPASPSTAAKETVLPRTVPPRAEAGRARKPQRALDVQGRDGPDRVLAHAHEAVHRRVPRRQRHARQRFAPRVVQQPRQLLRKALPCVGDLGDRRRVRDRERVAIARAGRAEPQRQEPAGLARAQLGVRGEHLPARREPRPENLAGAQPGLRVRAGARAHVLDRRAHDDQVVALAPEQEPVQHAQRHDLASGTDPDEHLLVRSRLDPEGQRNGRERPFRDRAAGSARDRASGRAGAPAGPRRPRRPEPQARAARGQPHASAAAHPLPVWGIGGSVAESGSSGTGL